MLVKVIELKNPQIEHDEIDGVDVSCSHELLVTGQREPEYDGDCQQHVHRLIAPVPTFSEVILASTEHLQQ